MKVMRFKPESITDILQILSGILNLGNVTFISAGGTEINEKSGKFETNMKISAAHICMLPRFLHIHIISLPPELPN